MVHFKDFLVTALLACSAVACGGGDDAESTDPLREQRGDTTIVTSRASTWGGEAELVEDLRFGLLEGDAVYMFGGITAMAADRDGGVYVFDRQVPVIRHFDSTGAHLRDIGRGGSGPGEFRKNVAALALREDGRLQVYDPGNSRISLFAPDGAPSTSWQIPSAIYQAQPMWLTTGDQTYVKARTGTSEGAAGLKVNLMGLVHFDADGGFLDTIPAPTIADPLPRPPIMGELRPELVWGWHPDGHLVIGRSDRYQIELVHADGTILRIRREIQPVALSDAEWEAREAVREWRVARVAAIVSYEPAATPRIKPFYRSFAFDSEGRIWVQIYQPATPVKAPPSDDPSTLEPFSFVEPTVYDLFESDGRYLGQVRMPEKTLPRVLGVPHVWVVQEGEQGEEVVVRLKIVPPPN